MRTLVVYYSYSGNTKRLAKELAAKESADTIEITDVRRPGKFKAYTAGCFAAMKGKAWPIKPLPNFMSDCDRLILFSPVWAGNPPPAVFAALKLLPAGKRVDVKMVSGSGNCGCKERLAEIIAAEGSILASFENIKA